MSSSTNSTQAAAAPPGLCIAATPGRGRCLRATRTFAPGSLVATFSSPLLAIPDGPGLRTTCNWCLRRPPRVALSACTACRCAVYCSKRCQAAGWRGGHKAECAALAGVRERAGRDWLPTPVRAAMLLLLRLGKGDGAVREAVGDVLAGRGGEGVLQGNVDAFRRETLVWEDLRTQAVAAAMYAGFEHVARSPDGVRELLCKIQTNAFDRSDPDTDMAGIFLDPVLAMANHSCVPNAFVSFSDRSAILRAETEIKEGAEIEISYIDNTLSKTRRQKALRLYHFQCQCRRCVCDLDVYQVCQSSPLVPLNSFSLQPDLQGLLAPRIDRSLSQRAAPASAAQQDVASAAIEEKNGLRSALERARSQWGECGPLIQANMLAVEPLPTVLHALANFYQSEKQDFASALSLACFLATQCHPFSHVAPFQPWRVKGVMLVAGLLSQTAPLSMVGGLAEACPSKRLVSALSSYDQVSMCEALLRLVIHYGPMAHSENWDVLLSARELLQDIESLQGREQQTAVLRAWASNPKHPKGKALFERVVLGPIDELASFAVDIASAELGGKSRTIADP